MNAEQLKANINGPLACPECGAVDDGAVETSAVAGCRCCMARAAGANKLSILLPVSRDVLLSFQGIESDEAVYAEGKLGGREVILIAEPHTLQVHTQDGEYESWGRNAPANGRWHLKLAHGLLALAAAGCIEQLADLEVFGLERIA